MPNSCSTCRHFHRFGTEPRGYCKLHPPVPFQNGSRAWPTMLQDESCGQFNEGQATVKEKVNAETPGRAAQVARLEKKLPSK